MSTCSLLLYRPRTQVTLSTGDRLGPYEVLAPIGAGGMGEVYKARDTRLDRIVAIKTLAGPDAERFRREARAIASLNHPHVCTLYDVGDNYLVMEYLEGAPLVGPLPPAEASRYALQICEALEAAHSRGITHRDLKPANILLTAGGVKLLDFGLATVVPDDDGETLWRLTATGGIVGTAAYMAPEQAEGKVAGPRSDIFSFGAVLYELLTGKRPFQGPTAAASIAAILRDQPAPLPLDIPPALRSVVDRCLEKEPKRRFASVAELKSALLASESASADGVVSIAVLPFDNLSRKEEDDPFVDGIAHELLHALSRIDSLRVAARSAAFRFKDAPYALDEVGRRLGVGHVVEGAVRVLGERLRITAQLVRLSDSSVLWSGRFDREMEDLFDIQDAVCTAIVNALEEKLTPTSHVPVRRPTRNIAAYDAYLRGEQLLKRLTSSEMLRGVALLEEAVRIDPDFALPLVGLSSYQSALAIQGLARSKDVLPRARELAQRALQIDAELPEAYRARGMTRLFQWDWQGGTEDYEHALELDPTYAQAHGDLVYLGSLQGTGEEAVRAGARLLEMAPLDPMYGWFMTQALCLAGHHQRALAQARATVAMDPGYMPIYWWLGMTSWLLGRREEAIEWVAKTVPFGDSVGVGLHASYLAQTDAVAEATAAAEELEERWQSGRATGISLVCAWGGLGETDRALTWLETAYEERDASLILMPTPWVDTVRDEPRFQEVLRAIGLSRQGEQPSGATA